MFKILDTPTVTMDIRVFVIGDRAVTKKRFVRDGDFRASGSGVMSWDIGDWIAKRRLDNRGMAILDISGLEFEDTQIHISHFRNIC